MEINFTGKRALVTGAARGIGLQIALSLARCGAQVIGLDKDIDPLTDALVTEIEKNPSIKVEAVQCDLSDWDATSECVQKLGDIDLLVNNAGIGIIEPFLECTSETFDATFTVNVKAIVNVSQIVAKNLIKRGQPGSIVHISSQASQRAFMNHALYSASKAALDSLAKSMTLELGPHGIRVNCVNPTVVLTDLGKANWSEPVKAKQMLSRLPLGRFCEVDEVVNGVLFLLSDKASMVTGSCLPIDGGMWAA